MERRQNVQTVSWLFDLFDRKRIDLDPPYQRKSVWTQQFKNYFIDTVLLNYPAPAIFLYEEISADGRSTYHVVDGKQRLTTIFEFIGDEFPIADQSKIEEHRGSYFSSLPEAVKRAFWSYQFSIEYLPTSEDAVVSDIFDRINRNVSKLSPQELRHAKLDGVFITEAERVADLMSDMLGKNFPRLADQSRKQMKDVELVASIFLLLELGAQSFSQTDLDRAFLDRDEVWDAKDEVVDRLMTVFEYLQKLIADPANGVVLSGSRLRNQVDFYSLVGAIDQLFRAGSLPLVPAAAFRLGSFVQHVDSAEWRESSQALQAYYAAARSASSDKRSREIRIQIMKDVITGVI
jgi:hypothetical protein